MRLRTHLILGVHRLGRVLERHLPVVARLAHPIWRAASRRLTPLGYWEQRSHLAYYREVARLARRYVPAGQAVLDVGARDTEVLLALDWFPRRVALDLRPGPSLPGVERVVSDFRAWGPPIRFDLVLCLQVLEHLEDPAAFIRKLRDTGDLLILSVPYRWPQGQQPGHIHDPIDEEKLFRWAGETPLETRIVMDEHERLIAVFGGAERE